MASARQGLSLADEEFCEILLRRVVEGARCRAEASPLGLFWGSLCLSTLRRGL